MSSVTVNVDSLVGFTGSLSSCNTAVTGTLTDFVTGGTGALIFTGPLSTSCGSVTISPSGDFVYTSPSGFTGPCSFVFGVTDGIGCSASGAITIVANTAPIVVGALIIPCADRSISDSLAGLVQNSPQPPLTFAIVTQPTHGTITNFNPATGTYTYTPNVGYIGLDSFQFTVTEASGCVSNVGTISVDVISCCPFSTSPLMIDILQQYWGMSGPTGPI